MNWDDLFKVLAGSGGTVFLLAFGLRWLDRDRSRLALLVEAERKVIDIERDKRMALIEDSSKRCADDRVFLHKEIGVLQTEVRELMKRMIAEAAKCGTPCMKP